MKGDNRIFKKGKTYLFVSEFTPDEDISDPPYVLGTPGYKGAIHGCKVWDSTEQGLLSEFLAEKK